MTNDKQKKPALQILILCALAVVIVLLAVLIVLVVRNSSKAAGEDESGLAAQTAEETALSDPETSQEGQSETGVYAEESDASTEEAGVYAEESDAAAEDDDVLPEGMVLACGDYQLTNQDFNYYYWDTYFGIVGSYGDSVSDYFDTSTPLSEQIYDEDTGETWEDYMLSLTVETAVQVTAFASKAVKEGYSEPDSYVQEYLDLMDQYETLAADQGFDSLEAYLKATYGADATTETFAAYLNVYYLALAYTDQMYNDLSFTDDEVEAYFDQYADDYASLGVEKTDQLMVDVRHILIEPEDTEDEASWDAAKAELDDIYSQWEEDPTEENFAALAEEYSDDDTSVGNGGDWTEVYNGGLYTKVYDGSMPEDFGTWLWGETRQVGDTEEIRTDYGWHLLYFSGYEDEPFWRYTAELDLRYDTYNDLADQLLADYPYYYASDRVTLSTPQGLYGG